MPLNTTIALTNVDNVAFALGIDCNVYALQIENAINFYSALLEGLTGRKLKARDYTDYLMDGKGGNVLFFDQYPVNDVDEILIYDINNVLYKTVEVADASKFRVHNGIGKLYLVEDIFLCGEQNIQITCNAGITDASELLMLEYAVIDLIASNNPSGNWTSSNVKSERLGSYSVTFASSGIASASVQNVISYFARI